MVMVAIAPLELYMEVIAPVRILFYVSFGLVLMNLIYQLATKQYISKTKLKQYTTTCIKITVAITIFQVCLAIFGLWLYPYFSNIRLEQKYQVKEIAFMGKINATFADMQLSHIPDGLVKGTSRIVFADHSLADLNNGQGINGFYSSDKDLVVITLDEEQFEITTHEFLHRLWSKKMNETQRQYFSDMYNLTCKTIVLNEDDESDIVITLEMVESTDGYYLDCDLMTDKNEEFAYKGAWYIEDVNRNLLTKRELVYFQAIAKDYGFRIAP